MRGQTPFLLKVAVFPVGGHQTQAVLNVARGSWDILLSSTRYSAIPANL